MQAHQPKERNLNIIQRVVAGGPYRKTRFHDERANFMGWAEFRHLPQATVQTFSRLVFSRYPELPWWPYPAIRHIEKVLRPDFHVWEYGSGMSSTWLARRVGTLETVDDNHQWHARVQARLARAGCSNASCELRSISAYAAPAGRTAPDFVVVDGSVRDECTRTALQYVKRPGFIYLDNSDMYRTDIEVAVGLLTEAAEKGGGELRLFVGLAPGMISSNQGLLLHLPT
jgi:hypothetical protein